MGRYESALAANDTAVEIAESAGAARTVTLTNLLTLRSTIALLRGDMATYLDLSERFYASAQRYELGYFSRMGAATSAMARATISPSAEAAGELDRRVGALTSTGGSLAAPIFLWSLAGAQEACGNVEKALQTVTYSQAVADRTGQQWYAPQILARRLHLQLLLGALPEDWSSEIDAMRSLAFEQALNVGAAHLALVQAEITAGSSGSSDASGVDAELVRAADSITEPAGAPLVAMLREMAAAMA
jgi:hypothetical protein